MAELPEKPCGQVDEDSTEHAQTQARPVPLNSRRVTLRCLKAIAEGLGLPAKGPQEQLRQVIMEVCHKAA